MSVLEIKDLHVAIDDKEILKGVNLEMKTGEIHAIMGPNGTGKSTLSAAIMGNPNYEVTKGEILFDGKNILDLEVDERARLGLFLAMQYPSEIPGISNAEFMRAAINARREEDEKISVMQFLKKLDKKMELLNMPEEMAERYLNEGFSGGEKKRNEILQLLMLEPKLLYLMRLTLVWISMPLKWFQKGSMKCVAKILVHDHYPLPTSFKLHYS